MYNGSMDYKEEIHQLEMVKLWRENVKLEQLLDKCRTTLCQLVQDLEDFSL